MEPPEGWGHYLSEQLLIEPYAISLVVLSAVAVYLGLLIVVRVFGARVLAATTMADAVMIIMLGAVAGRSILGTSPTVAAGMVALVTLVSLETIFKGLTKVRGVHHLLHAKPVLVFARGEALPQACERTHTSADDLNSAMRRAGVASPSEVQCIILEPRGSYSVILADKNLDETLFADVDGAEMLRSGP